MNITFPIYVANANNMKEVREKLGTDHLKQEWKDSLETPVDMLNCQMRRLNLKERQFNTFSAAEDSNIDELWKNCLKIEGELDVMSCMYCIVYLSNMTTSQHTESDIYLYS